LKDAFNNPQPVQKPHPRIWIGGNGNATLRVVAEMADGGNFWGLDPIEFEKR
jgi:alkanesulfonate monooxygenase SsuD/methylene tetrahydromethanopterin reductase-like flavin-dependent oxidoreductase (luciferase family)